MPRCAWRARNLLAADLKTERDLERNLEADAAHQIVNLSETLRSCFNAYSDPGAAKPTSSMSLAAAVDATMATIIAMQERLLKRAILEGRPDAVKDHRSLLDSFTQIRELMSTGGGRHEEVFAMMLASLDGLKPGASKPFEKLGAAPIT